MKANKKKSVIKTQPEMTWNEFGLIISDFEKGILAKPEEALERVVELYGSKRQRTRMAKALRLLRKEDTSQNDAPGSTIPVKLPDYSLKINLIFDACHLSSGRLIQPKQRLEVPLFCTIPTRVMDALHLKLLNTAILAVIQGVPTRKQDFSKLTGML